MVSPDDYLQGIHEYKMDTVIADVRRRYAHAGSAINEFGKTLHAVRWKNHEKDLLECSIENPLLIFCLLIESSNKVETERSIKYFKEGQMQKGEVLLIIDEFDESKLR